VRSPSFATTPRILRTMTTTVQIRRATSEDLDAVLSLLGARSLLLEGVRDHVLTMLVASQDNLVVGSAALEMYADGALLRSVAVVESMQGHGLGRRLTEAALQLATELGAPAVYLLTNTAGNYFPKLGFARIERATVPDGVKSSVEFTAACCDSAVVMRKLLTMH